MLINTLTQQVALEICNEWKSITMANANTRFIVIFNAKKMAGYEPMARITFQRTISELKGQIEKIWLVTDSKVISSGAAIISMLTSIPIKAIDSESKIVV